MGSDIEEDELKLPNDTLAALQDFYAERDMREKKFEDLKLAAELSAPETFLSMDMFAEDWNSSQFWYSDETATALAKQLLEGVTAETSIAVLCAPSVFIQLRNMLASEPSGQRPQIRLFEFDERFAVLGEFDKYDFQNPLKLNHDLKGRFDRVLCDPPFLSTDCQTKVAMTVRWLSRAVDKTTTEAETRVVICTGERMKDLIPKVYPGCQMTDFEPQHNHGRLSNEFRCYTNFDCSTWTRR